MPGWLGMWAIFTMPSWIVERPIPMTIPEEAESTTRLAFRSSSHFLMLKSAQNPTQPPMVFLRFCFPKPTPNDPKNSFGFPYWPLALALPAAAIASAAPAPSMVETCWNPIKNGVNMGKPHSEKLVQDFATIHCRSKCWGFNNSQTPQMSVSFEAVCQSLFGWIPGLVHSICVWNHPILMLYLPKNYSLLTKSVSMIFHFHAISSRKPWEFGVQFH